jgi:hypothetical protein
MKKRREARNWRLAALGSLFAASTLAALPARAHEIYTGLRGKDGRPCCGADDCGVTTYREKGYAFEFLTREGHWITIPEDRVIFLPIPSDDATGEPHRAHLCYRARRFGDDILGSDHLFSGGGQDIYLFCAFIPPGPI